VILVDAGPLVALISASDRHHARCRAALQRIEEPMVTIWPAFTEAMYLLRSSRLAQRALWEIIERGTIVIIQLDIYDVPRMQALMEKYHDLPMDLADAGLVRAAEREKIRRIFTLDRREFTVYSPVGIGRFSILPTLRD
jgi:predicted nucleic acid-binding protein